jgi:hypothetical protein
VYGTNTLGLVLALDESAGNLMSEQAGKAIKRRSSMVWGLGIFILDLSCKVITLTPPSDGAFF